MESGYWKLKVDTGNLKWILEIESGYWKLKVDTGN
jgi:hypothetical protein